MMQHLSNPPFNMMTPLPKIENNSFSHYLHPSVPFQGLLPSSNFNYMPQYAFPSSSQYSMYSQLPNSNNYYGNPFNSTSMLPSSTVPQFMMPNPTQPSDMMYHTVTNYNTSIGGYHYAVNSQAPPPRPQQLKGDGYSIMTSSPLPLPEILPQDSKLEEEVPPNVRRTDVA